MIFTNPDGDVVDINDYINRQFGDDLAAIKTFIGSEQEWQEAVLGQEDRALEIEVKKHQHKKFFHVQIHDLKKNRKSLGSVSLVRDITNERAFRENLIRRAEKDSMTQILNREAFQEKVNNLIKISSNQDRSCSLFMIDIDYFKQINDAYGHITGDEVIKEIVNIINSCSRTQDLVGRLGGDEFTMFLSDCDETLAKQISARIHKSIGSPG